jgi:hypothetical protein
MGGDDSPYPLGDLLSPEYSVDHRQIPVLGSQHLGRFFDSHHLYFRLGYWMAPGYFEKAQNPMKTKFLFD